MLQHKQEERELKRSEGDIIKKQQHLRRVMLDYENSKLIRLLSDSLTIDDRVLKNAWSKQQITHVS